MEKVKNQSKKMLIALISVSIALVCALGAIIGIWAATSQAVKSSFSVRYNVDGQVAARVTSFYQVIGDTELTQIDQTTFNAWENNTSPAQHNGPSITFDPANGKTAVRFIYMFETLSKDHAIEIMPSWNISWNLECYGTGTGTDHVHSFEEYWTNTDTNKNVFINYQTTTLSETTPNDAQSIFTQESGELYEFDLTENLSDDPAYFSPFSVVQNELSLCVITIVLGDPNSSAYVYSNDDYSSLTFSIARIGL